MSWLPSALGEKATLTLLNTLPVWSTPRGCKGAPALAASGDQYNQVLANQDQPNAGETCLGPASSRGGSITGLEAKAVTPAAGFL